MELISLNSTHPDNRRMSFKKIASVVLHILLVAALAYQLHGVAKVRGAKTAARMLTPVIDEWQKVIELGEREPNTVAEDDVVLDHDAMGGIGCKKRPQHVGMCLGAGPLTGSHVRRILRGNGRDIDDGKFLPASDRPWRADAPRPDAVNRVMANPRGIYQGGFRCHFFKGQSSYGWAGISLDASAAWPNRGSQTGQGSLRLRKALICA